MSHHELQEISDVTKAAWKRVSNSRAAKLNELSAHSSVTFVTKKVENFTFEWLQLLVQTCYQQVFD